MKRISAPVAAILMLIFPVGRQNAADDTKEFDKLMRKAHDEIRSGDWKGLAGTSERLCSLRSGNIWACYYRGLALTNTGRYSEGETWLKKAIAIDGTVFWPHYLLFFNCMHRGHRETDSLAANVERRITPELVKSNPADIKGFYISHAGNLMNRGSIDEARSLLNRGLVRFPKDPVLSSQHAFTYFRRDMKTWERLSRATLALLPREEQRSRQTYALPLRGKRIKVHQGNNETISHLGLMNGYHWDFVMVDESGAYGKNTGRKEGHYVFGAAVHAAADGTVVLVHDTSPDTEPMKNHPTAGPNRIVLRHPNGELTVYIHLKRGSGRVKPGDNVRSGQVIALVGCSGSFVDIPHLHFGVMRNDISLEARLTGFTLYRRGIPSGTGPLVPQKDDILSTGD